LAESPSLSPQKPEEGYICSHVKDQSYVNGVKRPLSPPQGIDPGTMCPA
jgi:hypothetical protein